MNFWRQGVIRPALDGDLKAAIQEQIAALERDPSNAEILVTESGGYKLVP